MWICGLDSKIWFIDSILWYLFSLPFRFARFGLPRFCESQNLAMTGRGSNFAIHLAMTKKDNSFLTLCDLPRNDELWAIRL